MLNFITTIINVVPSLAPLLSSPHCYYQTNHQTIIMTGHDMDRLNNAVNLGAVGYFMGLLYDQVTHP